MSKVACLFLLAAAPLHLVAAAPAVGATPKVKRDTVPDYAITYAPYSYLYSGESWWPSDVATHVQHVTPEVNFAAVATNVTLEDLDTFASDVYLTSDDNVEDNPAWLLGIKPDSTGYTSAPATIIVADKTDYVDVFYFYFYSYNHGLTVLGTQFGNHIGDWEHSMIRFVDGVPAYVYLSEHSSGSAYNYSAMTLNGVRPVTYIAKGSHANYATTGKQDYEGGVLAVFGVYDTTDAGPYWDVTQNYRGFAFDNSTSTFTSLGGVDIGNTEQAVEGVDWLPWLGLWGDEQYPASDSRQDCDFESITGECHYVSGPTGPFDKNLGRTAVCEHNSSSCTIHSST